MKKILFYTALLMVLVSPVISNASTVTVSTTPNYVVGHTYTANVVINPQSSKVYTAKVVVDFPSGLLQVQSFTFASGWLPLSQPGYDSVDNASGVLIKTGGYSGGLTAPTTIGTVTFYAKKTGAGVVSVGNSSQLLDQNNQNVFSTTGGVSVTIKNPVVAVAPSVAIISIPATTATSLATSVPSTTESEPSVAVIDQTANTAAAANADLSSTNIAWVIGAFAVVIIIIIIIGFWLKKRADDFKKK